MTSVEPSEQQELRTEIDPEPSHASAPASASASEGNMVPARERRRTGAERALMRLVATGGIVGIGTALGAILVSQDVAGWIVGLVVSLLSVVLAAVLWSSRQL